MNAAVVKLADLVSPKIISSVQDLDLVARWVVEGFINGLHRSPYVGFSVDFASHREYIAGDDLRHLNWKIYGRHDRLYIKQYDADTNVDVHLVVDISGSMTVGDGSQEKRRYAVVLAASLGHLASRQRDAVGLTLFADTIVEKFNARGTSDHLLQILNALAQPRTAPKAKTPSVLHEAAEMIPRRGLVVLISDLYYDSPDLLEALDHFRHFGHDVLVFHILAPIERSMPIDGSVKIVDAETGEEIETLAHEIRDSYAQAVHRWIDETHKECSARDIDYVCITTDCPTESALFDYFVKRSQLF